MQDDVRAVSLSERNQSLDALRGLAASLVLVAHASQAYAPVARQHGHDTWLGDATLGIDIGRTGVVLFFLISGFTVANSLRQSSGGVDGFAVRRFFRLYPLFWLSVLLSVVFFQSAPKLDWLAVAANLTMLPELFGIAQMQGVYWTLETELISYAIAALLLAAGWFNDARKLAVICGVLLMVFALMMFEVLPSARILQWQMLPHNLAIILWGSLFHLTHGAQKIGTPPPGERALRRITLLTAILLISPSCYALLQYAMHGKPEHLRWGFAYPFAFALFLLTFFWIKKVPHWLVWLGQISYSSYLLHVFVISLLLELLQKSSLAVGWVGVPLFVLMSLLATTAVANLSFVVLEKPAMRWGKALARRCR